MSYKALYNKYRPSTFEEVAGQQSIVRTLRNAINSNKIAHAYLFCGPRGTGKTSMARLFAKALNCEEGIGHQCNKCSNCLALNSSSHPDIIEIDAASNNGVDQVRELIDQVRYLPIKGRYKVYIIDEVHMMSQGAFNALLKTLEEPPDHVIFILATTEPHKVLPTILSRCQRYDFSKIDDDDLKAKLLWIAQKEGFAYEDGAINEIVSLADGGMRDALSILDQVLAYGNGEVNEKDILSVFGLASSKEKVDLLEKVIQGDVASILKKEEDFVNGGINVKRLCSSLLDILKDLLIYKSTQDETLIRSLKADEAKRLSSLVSKKKINEMIDTLLKTQFEFKTVSNVRSLFDLTLIKMASLSSVDNQEEKIERPKVKEPAPLKKQVEPQKEETRVEIKQEKVYNPDTNEKYTGNTVPSFLLENDEDEKVEAKEEPKIVATPIKEEVVAKKEEEKLDTSLIKHSSIALDGDKYELPIDTIVKIMVLGGKYKEERKALREKWSRLDYLKLDPKFGDAATLLSEGKPFCLCENAILINYAFTRLANKVNVKDNQDTLEELLQTILGRKVFIYALDRDLSNKVQSAFFNSQQLNTLPRADEIVLELPKKENKK